MKRSLKRLLAAALCLGVIGVPFATEAASDATNASTSKITAEKLKLEKKWDKVFPKSDAVNHRKITFVNRYGITLAADLYEPKTYSGKLPAIAVCGAFGRGAFRRGSGRGGGICPVLPQFFHFCGTKGSLSRGPVHPPRETWQRIWQGLVEISRPPRRGA